MININFRQIRRILVGLIVMFVVMSCKADQAQANFSDSNSYDIHFLAGDHTSVIKDVYILRFEEISGKLFLVVKSAEFRLKDAEGFIAYDAVVAVLPNQEFKVQSQLRIDSK